MTIETRSVADIVDIVMAKGDNGQFAAFNRAQRVVFAVADLDCVAAADGLHEYYDSVAGKNAAFAVAALMEIGTLESSALIRSANALFPDGKPALDLGRRRDQLEAMGEGVRASVNAIGEQFLTCSDNFAEKFERYVLANQKELAAE